jgi:Cu+-exporting ATPase
MKSDAQRDSTAHSCCGSHRRDQAISVAAAGSRQPRKKYFCPMCEGVESDTLGGCARCGMALERNPAFLEPSKIIYTCPMHPQI